MIDNEPDWADKHPLGYRPNRKQNHRPRAEFRWQSFSILLASNLLAMASDLLAMASNLLGMASNLIAKFNCRNIKVFSRTWMAIITILRLL